MPAGVEWDVAITLKAGDARRFAKQAVEARVDVVAGYGGDGTVAEAASGLMGHDVPLAIFPGGTANVMSVELGIPSDLAQACALVCNDEGSMVSTVDLGQVEETHFILRVGIGLEAELVEGADRALKDGEGLGKTPLEAKIIPGAVNIIVPNDSAVAENGTGS